MYCCSTCSPDNIIILTRGTVQDTSYYNLTGTLEVRSALVVGCVETISFTGADISYGITVLTRRRCGLTSSECYVEIFGTSWASYNGSVLIGACVVCIASNCIR